MKQGSDQKEKSKRLRFRYDYVKRVSHDCTS